MMKRSLKSAAKIANLYLYYTLFLLKLNTVEKLPSFKYKSLIFHNVKDNLFQTDIFGDKLIYKYENGKYYLVKDERLSNIISSEEFNNPNSYCNDDNNWK